MIKNKMYLIPIYYARRLEEKTMSASTTTITSNINNINNKLTDEELKKPRLGYACINNSLNYPKDRKDTTCRINSAYKAGEKTNTDPESPEYSRAVYDFLIRYGLKNTSEIIDILNWHVKTGMRFYRLSSALFPHIDNDLLKTHMTPEDLEDYRALNPFKKNLHTIAEIAFTNNIRLTMHPDPYSVLASPDQDKVDTTVRTLTWHALLFEIMEDYIEKLYGVKDSFKDSILCVHIGGRYDKLGGLEGTLKRWAKNFRELLPDYVQKRLCVENCEKNASAQDLLPMCEDLKIPLIFDFHHYDCYPKFHKDVTQLSTKELLPRIIQTWLIRGMRPKFHLSDQAPNLNIGAHHQFVDAIPNPLLMLMKEGKIGFDIMIEAKAKDYAVFYLLAKYPFLNNTKLVDPYSLIHKQYPGVPMKPIPVSFLLLTDTSTSTSAISTPSATSTSASTLGTSVVASGENSEKIRNKPLPLLIPTVLKGPKVKKD